MGKRPVNAQELPDSAPLTQYGEQSSSSPGFRDRLRPQIGETEISMILGEVDATAASMLVTHVLTPGAVRRVTTAGRLRQQGFLVQHSPTRGNPLHVSVFPPSDDATGEFIPWDDAVAVRFNACFTGSDAYEGERRSR